MDCFITFNPYPFKSPNPPSRVFNLAVILWIAFGYVAHPTWAAGGYARAFPFNVKCVSPLNSTYDLDPSSLLALELRLSRTDTEIRALEVGATFVDHLIVDIRKGGEQAVGIYAVQTPLGRRALKLSKLPLSEIGASVLIQSHLAELGYAPQVIGVLSEEQIALLISRYPELAQSGTPQSGVIMTEIREGWAIPRGGAPPEVARAWNKAAILSRVGGIVSVLNQLRVEAVDPQMIVSHDGVPYLMDFDFYRFRTKNNKYYGLQADILETNRPWWQRWIPGSIENNFSQVIRALQAAFR